jgi:hypothetical protein
MLQILQRARLHLLLALGLGLALRLWWIHAYPQIDGDSLLYGDIAKNWLLHGVYGFTTQTGTRPTLIRLPGYPLFLALCFRLFGVEHYHAVLFLQAGIDLAGCVLLAGFAAHTLGLRAGIAALYLSALCPFTANYTAAPMAETLTLFTLALGLYALVHYAERPALTVWFWALAFAISSCALLRPDGALLGVVLLPAMFWYARRSIPTGRAAAMAALCAAIALLPFCAWTVRNAHTFHVFQPLAPRTAADPGEEVFSGWNRWVQSWCVEFTSTYEIYWNEGSAPLEIDSLPTRALDTAKERAEVQALFAEHNATLNLTPEMDAEFARLAAQRIARNPLRFYVVLPALRLADMWLRPRTEMLWIELRWWQYRHHRAETIFAWSYAALNLAYLALAALGLRRDVPFTAVMLLYIALRCILLLTLECPEPRYTLECFPMIFILAAAALTSAPCSSSHPS